MSRMKMQKEVRFTMEEHGLEFKNDLLQVDKPIAVVRYDDKKDSLAGAWIMDPRRQMPVEAFAAAIYTLAQSAAAASGINPYFLLCTVCAMAVEDELDSPPSKEQH